MNEKITAADLADLLARRTGLSVEEANAFIKKIFTQVVEVLQEDKYLKIKDLGTFKLIRCSSRESVAVNTGERIVIDGYDKISFTPENALRDLINKPFAHFETISLNDGIDFEEESPETEEEETEEEPEEGPAVPSIPSISPSTSPEPGPSLSNPSARRKMGLQQVQDEAEQPEKKYPAARKRTESAPKKGGQEKEAVEIKTIPSEPSSTPVTPKNKMDLPKTKEPEETTPVTPKKPTVNRRSVATDSPQEEPEKKIPSSSVKRSGRVQPRLIQTNEEEEIPLQKDSAPESRLPKEKDQTVGVPSRAEIRKRKSILIQEPVPPPVPEQPEEQSEERAGKSAKRLFGWGRKRRKEPLLLEQEDLDETTVVSHEASVNPEEVTIGSDEETVEPDQETGLEEAYEEDSFEEMAETEYEAEDPEESVDPESMLPEEETPDYSGYYAEKRKRNFAVPFFICLALLVVLIGGLIISFLYYPQWLKDLLRDEGQSITIITVDAPGTLATAPEETFELGTLTEEEPALPEEAAPVQPEEKPAPVASERANPRDYKVTGTLTTLTIQPGTSLARIAREYYGSRDLWSHIVEYNKDIITNPDNIPVGKTIRIPRLEKK